MPRTFISKASGFAALLGFVFVVVLAGFGYALISSFRADDEALSTYSEELILGQSLEEAVQRKMASGRGFLLTRDEGSRRAFEEAVADERALTSALRSRVTSEEG